MNELREKLRNTGAFGERAAALWLELLGWRIIERNYRCRFGEVDIIASKEGFLSFIEVKTRSKNALVSGEEAVDAGKRRRITLAAQHYLQRNQSELQPRFDVIVVEKNNGDYNVANCIENAF